MGLAEAAPDANKWYKVSPAAEKAARKWQHKAIRSRKKEHHEKEVGVTHLDISKT